MADAREKSWGRYAALLAAAVVVIVVRSPRPAAAARQQHEPDPRGAIFVRRGCSECHGVWALGVKAKSDVAPDLTFAYVDVVNRYGLDLDAFLYNPSGVMRLMLASHLHLSAADRDSIAHVLKDIYRQHRAEIKGEIPPIVGESVPPN